MNFNKKIDVLEKKDYFIFKIDNFLEKDLFLSINKNFPNIEFKINIFDDFKRCSFSQDKVNFENENQKNIINQFNDLVQNEEFLIFCSKYSLKPLNLKVILRMIKYLRYPIKNNDLNSFTDYLFSKIDVQYVFSFIKYGWN